MIRIRVRMSIKNDLGPGPTPASEWMFGPVDEFRKKVVTYTPYWTGALRTSADMEEAEDGSGYAVTSGADDIINPITGTPTSEYASVQESLKGYMTNAYLISGVKQKLDNEANKVY